MFKIDRFTNWVVDQYSKQAKPTVQEPSTSSREEALAPIQSLTRHSITAADCFFWPHQRWLGAEILVEAKQKARHIEQCFLIETTTKKVVSTAKTAFSDKADGFFTSFETRVREFLEKKYASQLPTFTSMQFEHFSNMLRAKIILPQIVRGGITFLATQFFTSDLVGYSTLTLAGFYAWTWALIPSVHQKCKALEGDMHSINPLEDSTTLNAICEIAKGVFQEDDVSNFKAALTSPD